MWFLGDVESADADVTLCGGFVGPSLPIPAEYKYTGLVSDPCLVQQVSNLLRNLAKSHPYAEPVSHQQNGLLRPIAQQA